MFSPPRAPGRTLLALLAFLAVGSGAGLAAGLVAAPEPPGDATRALSLPEAQRLAAMRRVNFQDGGAGVTARFGSAGAETYLAGWVDWRRPLVYVAVSGPGAAGSRGLLQAVPGVIAVRPQLPGKPDPSAADGRPPATPPAGDWQLRSFAAASADQPLDSLLALILGLARNGVDAADALLHSAALWLGNDNAGGTAVDVVLGPVVLPTTTTTARSRAGGAGSSTGGAVRYWLDDRAGLHRLDLVLAKGVPASVEIDRTDRPELIAIDALGGRPVRARPVTAAEAAVLAGVRQRNRAAGGASLAVTLPAPPPTGNLRARGWVNWADPVVYLSVRQPGRSEDALLLRADAGGVAVTTAAARAAPAADGPPPLPPPRDHGWTYRPWGGRAERPGQADLDLLVNELLWLASSGRDDVLAVRAAAMWLRPDRLAGVAVNVFEVARPGEPAVAAGNRRLRYWVDAGGALRRLELRTSAGAFAQVDVTAAPAPAVAPVPIG